MRVKQIWYYVPIPAKVKLLVDRVTFSKITLFYVCFSFVHFVVQLVFQVKAFTINASAAGFLKGIIVEGNATEKGFTVLGQDLRMCHTVPNSIDASSCPVVWSPQPSSNATTPVGGNNAANSPSSYDVFAAYTSLSGSSSIAVASSSPIVSLPPISIVVAPVASTSVIVGTDSPVSSESASAVSGAVQSTKTVTATVRPTLPVALLDPSDSDTESSSSIRATATVTDFRTVTVKAAPTQSATSSDDVEQSEKRKRDTTGPDGQSPVVFDGKTLSKTCLTTLNWPLESVDNTKREDIVFIGFSFWVLGMSMVAVLNESPPHM
ncbi:hypothetical protein EIP86_003528 [Pleurotus ostreatoroseus]|nr:hypothetical protein EIP86_003528 [Pleurotus ostreatoroseus]